jgi:transcriptional regulator with XRE-family HTH domain
MCYYVITPQKAGENMSKKAEMKDRLREALSIREKKPIDLANDLKIPKSAISQYLSGHRIIRDSKRLYIIAEYLKVSEAWLMGFDVPMERTEVQKKNDTLSDIVIRMRTDSDFLSLVETLNELDEDQIRGVKQMLVAFLK